MHIAYSVQSFHFMYLALPIRVGVYVFVWESADIQDHCLKIFLCSVWRGRGIAMHGPVVLASLAKCPWGSLSVSGFYLYMGIYHNSVLRGSACVCLLHLL